MIPSLLKLPDNYLATAFKEKNPSFFPVWALRLVEQSPDWLVIAVTALFAVSWLGFLIGLRSQLSAILMTLACYYFYALNALHIGTLSFDILLVTLSLIWVTGYHGDWLSIDSLLRGDPEGYKRPRPFFIQRLLQWQIAWTFWYTALSKITAGGNWLTENVYLNLMHYPPMGVVRDFPFREALAGQPGLCRAITLGVPVLELALPLLWFIPRARAFGIGLGILFQVLLLATLHVPTIFFFLFPPMMLLFVPPERLVGWIEARRAANASKPRPVLLYDGRCGFCLANVDRLRVIDALGVIKPLNYHEVEDLAAMHPALTSARCHSRMQLVETRGRLSEGFRALRRISVRLPLLWPLAGLFYLPGAGWLGRRAYDWIARRRWLLHAGQRCVTNQCGVQTDNDTGSSSNTCRRDRFRRCSARSRASCGRAGGCWSRSPTRGASRGS
jgi:predicted DCC family thiol-disulfide oxidoreductase YuxK